MSSPTDQKHSDQEVAVEALMLRVGDRVRRAREIKGLPRRALAEASGVSMRYLAQLEAGEGNISIGLLQRVALALELPLQWLVVEEDPLQTNLLRLVQAYRDADSETRRHAEAILTPDSANLRANRVCLVGLRGAGKSTLGARAGGTLNVPFVELNREIESHAGMPVNELMALYGADGYRTLEAQALQRVIEDKNRLILAVAGGIVADADAYSQVLRHFHTVWVKASPEEHMSRVQAQGDLRPMAGNPQAMEQLRAILKNREGNYQRAHVALDTSGKTVETSAAQLVELIELRGFVRTT